MANFPEARDLSLGLEDLGQRIQKVRRERVSEWPHDADGDAAWNEMESRHQAIRIRLTENHNWSDDVTAGMRMDIETLMLILVRLLRRLGHRSTIRVEPTQATNRKL